MNMRMLLDKLFPGRSAESTEKMQPSATDDGQRIVEPKAIGAEQGQAEVDPVAPTMKEMRVAEPVAPTTEEPPSTRQTSLSGGAHDEGDPTDAFGDEEA